MAVSSADSLLGIGIYTPAEAALYARVTTQSLIRWIHGTNLGEPVVSAQLKGDEDRTVTFLDFVQAMAIRAIRIKHRIPLQRIREAVQVATSRYGIEHPFAHKHKTLLFGNEIYIELPDHGPVQLTGKHKGQVGISEVIELYQERLKFSDAEGLAVKFHAFEYQQAEIVIDPTRKFGQPFVADCGYSVPAIWRAIETEGSIQRAAVILGTDERYVKAAANYEDHLRGVKAA